MVYDPDYYKQKQSQAEKDAKEGSFKRAGFLQLDEGENTIRIIPAFGEKKDFWIERKISYGVGPKRSVIVPPGQFGKPDPLMDYIAKLRQDGDDVSKKEADKIKPKSRFIAMVVKRGPSEKDGPVQWNMNHDNYVKLLSYMADPEYGDITDAQKGVDIIIKYTPGEKTKNGFAVTAVDRTKRNPSPLGNAEQIAEWTSEDLFVKFRVGEASTPDYIEAVLAGKVDEFFAAKKAQNTGSNEGRRPSAPAPSMAMHDEKAEGERKLAELQAKRANASPVGDKMRSALD